MRGSKPTAQRPFRRVNLKTIINLTWSVHWEKLAFSPLLPFVSVHNHNHASWRQKIVNQKVPTRGQIASRRIELTTKSSFLCFQNQHFYFKNIAKLPTISKQMRNMRHVHISFRPEPVNTLKHSQKRIRFRANADPMQATYEFVLHDNENETWLSRGGPLYSREV